MHLSSAVLAQQRSVKGHWRAVLSQRRPLRRGVAANEVQPGEEPLEDGLTPEEDFVVPGGANDSLSSNTELGRAVRAASDELEHLSNLEAEVVEEAFDILKSFGIKVQRPSEVRNLKKDPKTDQ